MHQNMCICTYSAAVENLYMSNATFCTELALTFIWKMYCSGDIGNPILNVTLFALIICTEINTKLYCNCEYKIVNGWECACIMLDCNG